MSVDNIGGTTVILGSSDIAALFGTPLNSGGTATFAAVLGDVANSSVAARLTTLQDSLSGTTGITSFPAALAAANNVSLAEVIRYIQENGTDTILAQLSGAAGIASFPNAAAPANAVSIAEVIRSIWAALQGTAAGENGIGTWPAAAAPGNDVSIAEVLGHLSQQVTRTTAAKSVSSVTTANLFTISGGPVRIIALSGYVTTGLEATVNETKIQFTPTGGAANDVCAVYDVTGVVARTWLSTPFSDLTFVLTIGTSAAGWIPAQPKGYEAGAGVFFTGTLSMNCSATTTGAITWYVEYEPLSPGATIAAA